MSNYVETKTEQWLEKIMNYWGDNAVGLQISSITDEPYDLFVVEMTLYDTCDVRMEYDRDTLSIKVKTADGFKALSRIADQMVYRGFESYQPEHILHNFRVLDETVLKK